MGKDLKLMTKLETLSFANSPKITGELEDLKPLKLIHLDLGGSPLIRGYVKDLSSSLTYINLASAKAVGGDLKELPSTLVYANFGAALLFTGDVGETGKNGCKLKELDLGSSVQGIT